MPSHSWQRSRYVDQYTTPEPQAPVRREVSSTVAGEHFELPELNVACSGTGPNATKEQWIKLGEEIAARDGMSARVDLFGAEDSLLSEPVKRTMELLHELFSQAPVLGSLICPANLPVNLFQADYKTVAPLLAAVLDAQNATAEIRERVIAAAGMVKATTLLTGKYTLIATNVPYLLKAKQPQELRDFCEHYAPEAKSDLATVFLKRCAQFCSVGGTHATVTPQNWLFLKSYTDFRRSLLDKQIVSHVTTIGSGATATASWDVLRALLIASHGQSESDYAMSGIETDGAKEDERASDLRTKPLISVDQVRGLRLLRFRTSIDIHPLLYGR